MMKYIKCDCCGKPIYFGVKVYEKAGLCGKYCSPLCYTQTYANTIIMNETVATDSQCEVFEITNIIKNENNREFLTMENTTVKEITKRFEEIADLYEYCGSICTECDSCGRTYPTNWVIGNICPFCGGNHTDLN